MIVPCIDLQDGKVVQLVQGREKALEGDAPLVMLERFAGFPEIQVIDLDAAMGRGANDAIVELLAGRAKCRVGGGVRTPERAATLVKQGAAQVIVGTAAFTPVLKDIAAASSREKFPAGRFPFSSTPLPARESKCGRGRSRARHWRD